MLTATVLIVLSIVCRELSSAWQVWNFAPLGAVSLFAGSRLPRRWAWVVPVAAMAISDLFLDHDRSRPVFELTRWTIYATFAAITLLGPLANRPKIGHWLLLFLAPGSSALFFLTSNLATWGEGHLYPMTFAGLTACYTAAIPFYGNTFASELLGTALLFGLGPVFERAARRLTRPRLAPVTDDVNVSDPSRSS